MTPLRSARKKANITQDDLAKMIGVSHVTVSKYETGTIILPVNQAKKIAQALKIEWTSLYSDEDRVTALLEHTEDELNKAEADFSAGKDASIALSTVKSSLKDTKAAIMEKSRRERLAAAYGKLSDEGQAELVKRAEELAFLPQYQKQEPAGRNIDEIEVVDSSAQSKTDALPE